MREQTFQCLLKPHSCGASWRDKKLPAGGTQPKVWNVLSKKHRESPLRPSRRILFSLALVVQGENDPLGQIGGVVADAL